MINTNLKTSPQQKQKMKKYKKKFRRRDSNPEPLARTGSLPTKTRQAKPVVNFSTEIQRERH